MKILVVSSYLPYPLYDGGKIRLFNLIKELQGQHEITLVCETRENQSENDIAEVEKICKKVITFKRPKAFSFKNVIISLLTLNPFLITVHTHKKFADLIKKELDENNYDLIHVETFYVMQNLPETKVPIVLAEHNIEYLVYKRYAQKSVFFKKPILLFDALKIKRIENRFWKKADKLIAVSSADQKIMGTKSVVIANGVDIDKFSLKKASLNKNEKRVLFIGNFKWLQNRDSALYIIKNIWPHIRVKNDDKLKIKLWIVGKNIPENIKNLSGDDIIIDENAPDATELIFQKADILLTPIRAGGGTNFKILESMACGTPVVTNKLGNEGIDAIENEEIIISESPQEYATKTLNLLNDNYLYQKISKNSRNFIEKNYDWKKIARDLDKVYKYFAK